MDILEQKSKGIKFISAFTLAEVLITLGIIGIVAAMTIPTLINNYQKQVAVSRVKAFSSIFSQALQSMMQANGIDNLSNKYTDSEFWNGLSNQLKLAKNCDAAENQGCFSSSDYKRFNPKTGTISSYDTGSSYKGVLVNGTSLSVNYYSPACTANDLQSDQTMCGHVFIDVNGKNSPNQVGKDTFAFHIMANGRLIPFGAFDDVWSGCDSQSTDIAHDITTGAPGVGYGCTAKIILGEEYNF